MMTDKKSHRFKWPAWCRRLLKPFNTTPKTKDDLCHLVNHACQDALVDAHITNIIKNVLSISDKQARDIMLPRAQMCVIDVDANIEDTLPLVVNSTHSRFPVIAESRDEVVGILLAKDLLKLMFEEKDTKAHISSLIRPATIIPESKRLDSLLREFQKNRQHMAIVLDEYGSVAGLITIENVLEQIVGDIEDEYDFNDEKTTIKKINQQHFVLSGLTPIDSVNQYFSCQLPHDEVDTIGGLISMQCAHIPKIGETIQLADFHITILEADDKQILSLKLKPKHLPKPTDSTP